MRTSVTRKPRQLGRTVSSILFSRNDASYCSRQPPQPTPEIHDGALNGLPVMIVWPSGRVQRSLRAAPPITSFPFCRPHYTYTATILVLRKVLFVALVATPAFCKACGQDDLCTVVISKGRMAVGRGGRDGRTASVASGFRRDAWQGSDAWVTFGLGIRSRNCSMPHFRLTGLAVGKKNFHPRRDSDATGESLFWRFSKCISR